MKFSRETAQPAKSKSDALIVGVYANESIKDALKEVDSTLSGKLADSAETHAQEEGFKGKRLEFLSMPAFGNIAANRLIFIGLGESAKPSNFRKAAACLYRRLTKQGESKSFTLYMRGKKVRRWKEKA